MKLILSELETEEYLKYRHAIDVAKKDSYGLVVTSDQYNDFITSITIKSMNQVCTNCKYLIHNENYRCRKDVIPHSFLNSYDTWAAFSCNKYEENYR
jgi:hypothetical protein